MGVLDNSYRHDRLDGGEAQERMMTESYSNLVYQAGRLCSPDGKHGVCKQSNLPMDNIPNAMLSCPFP